MFKPTEEKLRSDVEQQLEETNLLGKDLSFSIFFNVFFQERKNKDCQTSLHIETTELDKAVDGLVRAIKICKILLDGNPSYDTPELEIGVFPLTVGDLKKDKVLWKGLGNRGFWIQNATQLAKDKDTDSRDLFEYAPDPVALCSWSIHVVNDEIYLEEEDVFE